MPAVLPLIPLVFGATSVIATITSLVLSVAVGAYEQQRAKKKARDAYNRSLTDRITTVRQSIQPREYIVGTVRKGGVLLNGFTVGTKREALDTVVAIACNKCELVGYYLNDAFYPVGNFPTGAWGKLSIADAREQFNVTGTSDSISLQSRPPSGTPIVGTWRQGSTSGSATVTLGVGTACTVTGLPSGDSALTVAYKVNSAAKIRIQFKDGDPDQTVTNWDGYSTPAWTANHRLRGVAHLRGLNIWDENIYTSGAPNMGAVLKGGWIDGHPFFDPRTSSNPAYTDNPAILWAWWATLPRKLGGCGIPSDWIDWGSVAAAANICDEIIVVRNFAGNGYDSIKRYQCHTVLSTETPPLENLEIIQSAMAGKRAFTAGKYRLFAGAFRPATLTLTDDDIDGEESLTVITADDDDVPPNVVTGRYANARKNWIESTAQPVINAGYIAADGHEEALDLALPSTTDARQANYLMGIALEESRPRFTVAATVLGAGENLALGDTLQLNLSNRTAYAGRTFEVVRIVDHWNGKFDISLAEMKSTTYALDPETWTPIDPPETPDLSYIWNVAAPTGFQVEATAAQALPDGTAVMRVTLSWDTPTQEGVVVGGYHELRYRSADGEWAGLTQVPGDATSTQITANLIDGEFYQFQLRAVNSLGSVSDWVDAWTQISATPLPTSKAIRLRPTSLLFVIASGGGSVTPSSITLHLDRIGELSEAAAWETTPEVTLGGSGDTRTLAYTDIPSDVDSVRVDVEVDEDGILYLDTVTILKLHDGSDAPDYTPDLTPPPTPQAFQATPAIFHNILEWAAADYTEGHGHAETIVYGKRWISGALPVFVDAEEVGSSAADAFSHPVGTSQQWHYWIKHKSVDGVVSTTPAGGTNGMVATTGKIGNTDLGPLIVEAGNLANGSVGATQLAAQAVTATKFATGIEPVTVVASVPGAFVTRAIFNTADGNLYRWNGSAYVRTVAAGDLTGQLTDAQIAAIAAAKVTGQITGTQITDGAISTPKLAAGSVTTAALAADSVTANQIAANAVTASEIAANAVTANAIAANAVVAGKIAAGAVNTDQLAANAVTASKVLITGRGAALNDDPGCVDTTAWFVESGAIAANTPSSIAPGGFVVRTTGPTGFYTRAFPISSGKRYRVSASARQVSGSGLFYLRLYQMDASGAMVANVSGVEGVTITGSHARYTGHSNTVANAVSAQIRVYTSWTGTGTADVCDIRCEEGIPGELIVDGAITATKIAANAIAVGTAAIENGAIVNAMIGNLAVDAAKIANATIVDAKIANGTITNAKIANLDAAKINAGTLSADRIGAGSIVATKLALLTAGGTSIDMSNGRITFDNGVYLRAQGTGFGTGLQFVDWYGPRPSGGNVALCSETNAIYYLTVDGDAYFGGSLNAGVLRNAVRTTDTSAGAEVQIGPFLTNGGTKTIVLSYAWHRNHRCDAGTGAINSQGSATAVLERSINGSTWTQIGILNVTGSGSVNVDGDPAVDDIVIYNTGGTSTVTDNTAFTTTMYLRARITARTLPTFSGTGTNGVVITQSLGIISTE